MMSTNGDAAREIHLVDPELEGSTIISLLLDVIVKSEIRPDVLAHSAIRTIEVLLRLFTLFDKYQMDRARNAALVWLSSCRCDSVSPLHRFIVGAMQDDIQVCLEALRNSRIVLVRGCYRDAVSRERYDLDPRFMASWDMDRIPPVYFRALLRAWDEREKYPIQKGRKVIPYQLVPLFEEYVGYFKECAVDEAAAQKRSDQRHAAAEQEARLRRLRSATRW